ncbi:hypothetical protein NUW58_g428 [Xylaria curta]|uniref:Uncharacterized protein n=1 Tax=Xylaria curta TaxID=42375 RepID=A0ACC1PRB5_9PEZI|nr:hypothetical protein NUW58_g428 [Xylaria curta]
MAKSGAPPDYYRILEVSETATTQQIRDAYKRAALKTHPDRVAADSPERASRTRKFQLVNDAYYTLSDSTRRRDYDAQRVLFGSTRPKPSRPSKATNADPPGGFASDFEEFDEEIPVGGDAGMGGANVNNLYSWAWNFFMGSKGDGNAHQARQEAENAQFADVFEEMLHEEAWTRRNSSRARVGGTAGVGAWEHVFYLVQYLGRCLGATATTLLVILSRNIRVLSSQHSAAMAKPIEIESAEQLSTVLKESRLVVADFYANWCGPCKQIAPFYEQLSRSISKPKVITFVKINTETQRPLAAEFAVTALPTFILFRDGTVVEKVKGANPQGLRSLIEKLSNDIESGGEGSSSSGSGGLAWRGADLPRGYTDISDVVDVRGLELLNADTDFSVRTLFNKSKPSSLDKSPITSDEKDWVESDTDEQLLLFAPFNSASKLHTLQLTSLPPTDGDDDDETPMRPKTIKLFTNRPHNLGFDEADDIDPTQTIEIGEDDWNSNGTANLPLRFVRFQNITSLVIFVVDGDGDGDKVRLDRVRLIGESGEKREMGKLEKIGDEAGE